MARIVVLIVLGLATVGLMAGAAIGVTTTLAQVAGNIEMLDLEGVSLSTTGLDELNPTALLPVMQIFMGKAAILEEIELPQATSEAVGDLNLTLPPGWQIAQDEQGADKTYQTADSIVVMVEDQDGNFAVISRTEKADPEGFLATTTNQYSHLLETSGFDISTYTVTMSEGQQAQAIDVQQADLVIRIRGWVSDGEVYIIALTSNPEDLAVSLQIFDSLS